MNKFSLRYKARQLSIVPIFLLLATAAQADDLKISLKCDGSGSKSDTETTYKTTRNKSEHSRETGTEQAMIKREFKGSMLVEIHSNMGQVKIPVAMLPPLQKDEAADWFPINDYKVSDTEITGQVRINFLNKPELRIDRTTGTITVANGLNEFAGDCKKIDENAKPLF
ncbi:hypothetical protein [Shewanella sp.]|uniref:hypothetical protein n=1 Tax=Shewanella sp. TaxID=50422 RepID=UPI003A96BEE7